MPDAAPRLPAWKKYVYAWVGEEISRATRYYDAVFQWRPVPGDAGYLLDRVECGSKEVAASPEDLPESARGFESRVAVLVNGNFNTGADIQDDLEALRPRIGSSGRVLVVAYNPYVSFLYRIADALGLRNGPPCTTFLTRTDLTNVARLAGYEIVRIRPAGFVPFPLLGLGTLANVLLPAIPFLRWFALVNVVTMRPAAGAARNPSLSIVVPARNEKGNIAGAVRRLPDFGAATELLFVEGHSSDGTWEEIERVVAQGGGGVHLACFRQQAKGKADAVRLGFEKASGEVLTILDADLTMPPEKLTRFYDAYRTGCADFVNGTRLVYPMEDDAMRFLNRLGNVFFAKALSYVLDAPLADSLCGTKLLARHDYERIRRWNRDFGSFDPFGDFELLFPAAVLGLRIVDVPVRYSARTYGSTNIDRFRHGWLLLRMTLTGLFRIKMGTRPRGRSERVPAA
jgi:hypothetical protein